MYFFRTESCPDHARTKDHQTAVEAESCGDICDLFAQSHSRREKAILTAIKSVYWIAKEEIANHKYASLLQFLRLLHVREVSDLHVGENAKYTSHRIFDEILVCLNRVVEEETDALLHSSPYLGVGVDESTDVSVEKHLAIIARAVTSNGLIVAKYVKCVEMADGKGLTMYATLKSVLEDKSIALTKVLGFGSDGARAMVGARQGMQAYLLKDTPFCVPVHCVNHRLALAVSQAASGIPCLRTFQKSISTIYSYYSRSAIKTRALKDIQKIVDDPQLKVKDTFEIRWLSLGDAVHTLRRCYTSLRTSLEQDAADGDDTACGLVRRLKSYEFIATLNLMCDVLDQTNSMSRVFQSEDIMFQMVESQVSTL